VRVTDRRVNEAEPQFLDFFEAFVFDPRGVWVGFVSLVELFFWIVNFFMFI